MLSLSPRYDLVRFLLPHDFLPEEVVEKWQPLFSSEAGVLNNPLDYLNESIQTIEIGGISDINVEQSQVSTNIIKRENGSGNGVTKTLGRINREPGYTHTYVGSENPLNKTDRTITIGFRMNQNLYNFFMILQTIHLRFDKPWLKEQGEEMYLDILDESGTARVRFTFNQCHINGMDGLSFGYDKVTRSSESFSVSWVYNNFDIHILNVPQT